MYRKIVRRFRKIPLKWAVGAFLALVILVAVLSQSATVRTFPYYLQFRFAKNNQQIFLSQSKKQSLDETTANLRKSLAENLNEAVNLFNAGKISNDYNAWGFSDLIVSLSGANYPLDQNYLNSTIDKLAFSEECWKEEKNECKMAVSGWVLWSKSRLDKPVSAKQLNFILRNQAAEGWFPAHPYPDNPGNASTYPTAILIFGLNEQLRLNLIDEIDKERVKNAIKKGAAWILQSRNKENKRFFWIDCPNAAASAQTSSDGLDGLVIFTLHQIAKSKSVQIENLTSDLREIDLAWLERLTTIPKSLEEQIGCRCGTVVGNEAIYDRTTQIALPWTIAATIEAFPNSTLWQKAKVVELLENVTFPQTSKGTFIEAEYLIALTLLRENIY